MQVTTETKVGLFVLLSIGIFTYLAVHLGIFHFNVKPHQSFYVTFDNVAGITEKSDIKIAGVKVGWVESIKLTGNNACVRMSIKNGYQIHDDAYAIIRQEGIIGTKYIEIVSGSPQRPLLMSGSTFAHAGEGIANMDTIMQQCRTIADRVANIAGSVDQAIGTAPQTEKLQFIVNNLASASEKLVTIADHVSHTIEANEQSVNTLVSNLAIITNDLRVAIPDLKKTLDRLAQHIETGILPSAQESMHGVGTLVQKLQTTADTIQQTVQDARSGIGHLSSVAQKVDAGTGLLGKLINDDKVYNDICNVTCSIKNGLDKFNGVGVDIDFHSESMWRPVDCYCHPNNKGYFEMRYKTCPDWFYAVQLVASEQGWPERLVTFESYCKANGACINSDSIVLDNGNIKVAPTTSRMCVKRNNARFDLQAGKIFNHFTLRAGTFEHTFGIGLDINIPFNTDSLRWITTLEMFDLYGQNRVVCERMPHLKWLNRLVLFNNLYLVCGVDDFASRCNINGFAGVGLRFNDDDLKHLASKLGFLGSNN